MAVSRATMGGDSAFAVPSRGEHVSSARTRIRTTYSSMHLYVMRHGPAVDRMPSGRDFDRTLSEPGRRTVEAVAKELARRIALPVRIFTSPLVRTQQTAEIV